ncbi:hypothetical protein EOL96_01130 [Candidatus Saccharibacteria bacterium]|nr:hypothetical protein [Candidatus Saccharibacteria bacterium]
MAEKLTVLVDMDGVMAGFDDEMERRLYAMKPSIIIPNRANDFYITKRLTSPEDVELARSIQTSQDFFRSLPPIEGALEGWSQIKALGYHARICSAPLTSNPWCVSEKLEWLDAYLGPNVVDEAIIDKDKSRYTGIALIDDRPVVNGSGKAPWQHVVFSQPYNNHIKAEYRLTHWQDPCLPQILAQCAMR